MFRYHQEVLKSCKHGYTYDFEITDPSWKCSFYQICEWLGANFIFCESKYDAMRQKSHLKNPGRIKYLECCLKLSFQFRSKRDPKY